MKNRILVLATRISGGVGSVGKMLVEGLRQHDYHVDFAATSEDPGSAYQAMLSLGLPVIAPNKDEFRRRIRCERLLDMARSYDIVLANDNWEIHAILPEIGPQIPTVVIYHGTQRRFYANSGWNAEYAACHVAICSACLPLMKAAGIPEENSRVVFNGVKERTAPLREGNGRKILFCGRLAQIDKNIRALPAICFELHASGVGYELHIAGQGPDEAALRLALKKFGSNVVWHGHVPPEKAITLLEQCDFLVLPSFTEALSIALLEAMSVGCVPILSDIGPLKAVVREYAAQLCHAPSDAAGMARTIVDISNNPSRFQRLSAAMVGIQREHYSQRSMIEGYLRIIESASPACLPTRKFEDTAPLRWRLRMSSWYEWLSKSKRKIVKLRTDYCTPGGGSGV